MKWVMKEPVCGDMIRVESGTIYHFGVYVSDDEVIQFGLAPSQRATIRDSEVEVVATDIDQFLAGGFLEVCELDRKERKQRRKPKETVEFARSKLGMRGYNIIYNNCEHFANECVLGQRICRQAEDVREMFRNMPVVDVYLAKLPDRDVGQPLACPVRQAEVEAITNQQVKREKYYVWKLLEYGLERTFGLKSKDLTFTKNPNGGYKTEKAEFSLSHSGGALAVAISRGPVGVDVEDLAAPCRAGMPQRSMTQKEYAAYQDLPEAEKQAYFVRLWTAKEALFKASHSGSFDPAAQDTDVGLYRSFEKTVGDRVYALSVATATPERIRVFENIQL